MLEVRVRAPVRPSEDARKVEQAVRTIFPEAVLQAGADELVATSGSLEGFRHHIWKSKILDAARRVLLGSLDKEGTSARFELNKQAAFAGNLSFSIGDAPLGDLVVEVQGDDLEAQFKEIAPPTLRGKPVSEELYAKHLEVRRKQKFQNKTHGREIPKGDDE